MTNLNERNARNAKVIEEFRSNGGKVANRPGQTLLLLGTTGAKSGLPRTNPVSCLSGEDCLYGQEPWSWCHPSGSEGVTLAYGADPNTLVEGEQTVFTHPNFAYVTTYMITRERDGACWAFGHDPSYFAAAGCKTF